MKARSITRRDLLLILPISLALGAWLAFVQNRGWPNGILSFSLIFFLGFVILKIAQDGSGGGRAAGWAAALAFFLRLAVGIALFWALPIYGHADADDRAGYVYTDAHTRDVQAWRLAASDAPIVTAFSREYSSDQYGGLLAFNALIYRYLSPDARRPLMLVLVSAFFAALGVPFLWSAVRQAFGQKVARASAWIFALYPESILLGASAMREPYLLTFSALALWGFASLRAGQSESREGVPRRSAWIGLAAGLLGMLLVSPAVALTHIVILAGWAFFGGEGRVLSWKTILAVAVVFILGLFLLSSSLNRTGEFEAASPLHVINDWMKIAVRMNVYEIEQGSGWVQKIFDEGPRWIRLPFIAIYGVAQPVLPATVLHPTKPIWTLIGFLRGLGWYALLPLLVLSFRAAVRSRTRAVRNILLWLALIAWIWILLAALRGGADLYDNPRYRTILFAWEAVLGGCVWAWWREARDPWFLRVLLMEGLFLLVFTQWYASRYYHWGGQLPFPLMIGLILLLWGAVLGLGWWRDRAAAKRA